MTDFLTQKQTEHLLELQSRKLPMANGDTRPISGTNLFWQRKDLYMEAQIFTFEGLTRMVQTRMVRTGCELSTSLHYLIAEHDRRMF